jgi:hypothetical protein
VSENDLLVMTEDLLAVEDWPLDLECTQGVAVKLLAEFSDVPVEDLVFAVGSYRLMDPIKAESATRAFSRSSVASELLPSGAPQVAHQAAV